MRDDWLRGMESDVSAGLYSLLDLIRMTSISIGISEY
jgi:hypothetical protein